MEEKTKRLSASNRMFLMMMVFGLVMGVIFPIYAGFFVNWIEGYRIWFNIGSLAAGCIVGVMNFYIYKITLKRFLVNQMGSFFNELKQGKLDKRLAVEGRDELSYLSIILNDFVSNLQTTVKKINGGADILSKATTELSFAAAETLQSAQAVNKGVEESSKSVNQTSSAANEVAALNQEIELDIEEINSMVDEAQKSLKISEQSFQETDISITKIVESSKKIEGIVNVISTIAHQTNLLSLNAGIEAAKAGEFGKGFAVVAEEVRKLAEKSHYSAKEIQKLIRISTLNVTEGTNVVKKTGEEFRKMVQPLTLISQLVEKSNEKMRRQNQRTKEMTRIQARVSDISVGNANSMNQLFQTLKESTKTVQELSELADALTDQIAGFQT
jgi:methyl-accepting chemotaxis protein